MKKLKLQPLANAKKLSRNELKNIFGGEIYGGGDFIDGKGRCYSKSITCYNNDKVGHCESRNDDRCVCFGSGWSYFAPECVR